MRVFFINDMNEKYIIDIDEATNYSLEKIKNCYQLDPLRPLNTRSPQNVNTKRQLKKRFESGRYSSLQSTFLITLYTNMETLSNC